MGCKLEARLAGYQPKMIPITLETAKASKTELPATTKPEEVK